MRRALVILAVLGACGGEPPPPGAVALGGARPDGTGFAALDGDVELVPGSQGGFHVWLKLRTRGLVPGRALLHRTARRASDGRLLLTAEGPVQIGTAAPDGWWESPPIPAFMCPSPLGVRVMDERVTFRVELRSEDGALLGEVVDSATPRCPAGEQAEFCARICAG